MGSNQPDVARALPDYEILDQVGHGEFGVVWRARHVHLGREVAVKALTGPTATTDEQVARFRREARILAQLDHPHVVTVYDYREHDDLRLIVMELLPGGTFGRRRTTGITGETAIAAVLAAASGLHHVHELGILHRDVKPENLMFDSRDTLKVTDFGIARVELVDPAAINLTQAGKLFGTPAYVSPEQAAHALGDLASEIGPASDQYSLAVVLYEALSGRLTHDATGGAIALCNRRVHEPARPLREVAPAWPSEIETVVMRALERAPGDRYPSIGEFGLALAATSTATLGSEWTNRSDVRLRDNGPIRDAALGISAPSLAPPPPPPPDPPSGSAPAPRLRRRRIGVVIVLAFVLFGAAAGIAFALSGGPGSDPTPPPTSDRVVRLTTGWSVPTGAKVFSSPAGANGLAVVGSGSGSVFAIDAVTGAIRWQHATAGPVRSSPAIDGGKVYVGGDDKSLYAIDLGSGRVDWRTPIRADIVSTPAVAGGTVVVGADRLYAFDTATGTTRWVRALGDVIVSSPAITGTTVVVGSNDGSVYGVSLVDGTERWRVRTGGQVLSSPTVSGGVAFVGSNDGSLAAIDATTGARRWSVALGAPVHSSPLAAGGRVFVGTSAGRLISLDAASGRRRWTFAASGAVDSSPTVVNGLIVVGANDGKLHAVDERTGAGVASIRLGGPVLSSPLAVDDGAVVGTDDGRVVLVTGFPAP